MGNPRIDPGQVREAIAERDCRGYQWWRVLVEDILNDLVLTRWRESDALKRAAAAGEANSEACDEITRLHNWIAHWNENGAVGDEFQMALDGDDSPRASPQRKAEDPLCPECPACHGDPYFQPCDMCGKTGQLT